MLTKEEAEKFLKESIHERRETGDVAVSILDLGVVPKDSPALPLLKSLVREYLIEGDNRMSRVFRPVDKLSEQTVNSFNNFFSPAVTLSDEIEALPVRQYAETVGNSVKSALRELAVPVGVTAEQVLQDTALQNVSTPAGWSKNRWKKAVRLLARIEQFLTRMLNNVEDAEALICSKSRLSYLVNTDNLSGVDLAVTAYLVSRANRRSQFTTDAQSKAFDTIHESLTALLDSSSNWFELAKVYPTGTVFKNLPPEQLGQLLGTYHSYMLSYGLKLEELYLKLPEVSQERFHTALGADSSRWNAYSGAFNNMRSAWVNLTTFLNLDFLFETALPGKAPRMMAHDLYRLHQLNGNDEHQDSELFHKFPKPWEILKGEATLNLSKARKYDGWVAPLRNVGTENPSVEPALIHGVVMKNPLMAELLKKSLKGR